jgi:hypothetical protein
MVHIVELIRSAQDLTFPNCRATIAVASKDAESPPSLVEEKHDFQVRNAVPEPQTEFITTFNLGLNISTSESKKETKHSE